MVKEAKNGESVANNSEEAVVHTLSNLIREGSDIIDPNTTKSTGAGHKTKEIIGYKLTITNPLARLTTNPHLKFRLPLAVARFTWLISGNDRLQDIAFYTKAVGKFSDDGLIVPGSSYGKRMRNARPGLDQLVSCIEELRRNPASRRAAVSIYYPEDSARNSRDIPCAFGIFFHIREEQLITSIIMRSNNAFMLMPYNIFEFSMLAEIVANNVGVKCGKLVYFAGSMHLYERDFKNAKETIESFYRSPEAENSIMNAIPPGEGVIESVNEFCMHEAVLRHESGKINNLNIKTYIDKAESALKPYWFQFYLILLSHIVDSNKCYDAFKAIELKLNKTYLPYLKGLLAKSTEKDEETISKPTQVHIRWTPFEKECDRIYKQYIPMTGKTIRYDDHYKSFKLKHREDSPEKLSFILEQFKRYDLSDLGNQKYSLNKDSNRNHSSISEKKLKQISRDASNL
ncbi:thymidylate synthase [Cerasicoccus frondis]|uniref:thymidylate synthase n=1 Tax=Cerasicoccus frondis TaxID=490090 RepID=UPI002852CCDD|nr:thymidylate synthase [Cerasicoccus frondis]